MNKEESLALYKRGSVAWNAWAKGMLAERVELEESGRWLNKAKTWVHAAEIDFSGHIFYEVADFSGFIFPWRTEFNEVTFSADALVEHAKFSGDASFRAVRFSGDTSFDFATFSESAVFRDATFSKDASFDEVLFSEYALFDQVTFAAYTSFEKATFEKEADFVALRVESLFTLENAVFKHVPDFDQAHFAEAPRLDISRLPKSNWRGEKMDLTARWRALKRLATQAHDYERERYFFAEEVRAARNVRDHPFGANYERYWSGLLYEFFSDFGRSMWRPVVGWGASIGVFAALYRLFRTMDDGTWASAFFIALRKGAIFAGRADGDKLSEHYANLFCDTPIPDWVAYAGMAQTVISAVFIFLLLLAVRNHFRIK